MTTFKELAIGWCKNHREVIISYGVIAIISLGIYLPTLYQMIAVFPRTDFGAHQNYILRFDNTHSLIFDRNIVANPLFTFLSLLTMKIFSVKVRYAMFFVLMVNWLTLAFTSLFVIVKTKPSIRWLFASTLTLSILFYSPIFINLPQDWIKPFSYIPILSFHNPTIWLGKLFSLISFAYFLYKTKTGTVSPTDILFIAIINICSILSKPNYAMGFLPILGLFVIYQLFSKEKIMWKFLVWGYAVPMVLTLSWQYWLRYMNPDSVGILIQPFLVITKLANSTPVVFGQLLSILFPLSIVILNFRDAIKDRWLILSWSVFIVSWLSYALFAESGRRVNDGNFLWGPEMTLFNLVVISLIYWLTHSDGSNKKKPGYWIPLVLFLAGGVSGILYAIFCANLR